MSNYSIEGINVGDVYRYGRDENIDKRFYCVSEILAPEDARLLPHELIHFCVPSTMCTFYCYLEDQGKWVSEKAHFYQVTSLFPDGILKDGTPAFIKENGVTLESIINSNPSFASYYSQIQK